ncbi:hypothetical protein M513_05578 [Trichuris suis]|uniref:Uncharacterized protein n=1 Tax=Trichuris suis TaxID=68888 RepID=A0A085M8W6_9BILA|nr:hypothetical protein M513_05578 [Trichuris suis]
MRRTVGTQPCASKRTRRTELLRNKIKEVWFVGDNVWVHLAIANEPDFRLRKIKEVWFVGDNVWVHLAIANEPDFRLRKIKEALYIRHNVVINRDKGTEVSDTWTNLIMRNRLCSTTTTTTTD